MALDPLQEAFVKTFLRRITEQGFTYEASARLGALTERYRKWCKQHSYNFSESKAAEVHAGAQDLFAMLPKDAVTDGPAGD